MKNKTAGLLMEVGATYNKKRLYGKKYFDELLESLDYVPDTVVNLLKISKSNLDIFTGLQKTLIAGLLADPHLKKRVDLLRTIPGIGEITALTWVLEIGEVERFGRISQAVSSCGLCSAQNESAGKNKRGPISQKRNKHLQTVLIEAAKLAPRWNPELALIHEKELGKGNRNRATLAIARKLVAYMMAVDKRQQKFIIPETVQKAA